METLFPKASRKARDLISKMLTMDASNRISVTKALNHPFLSKYHDPDDEPICIPVFDFEFERQASVEFGKASPIVLYQHAKIVSYYFKKEKDIL